MAQFATPSPSQMQTQVRQLYKTLLWMGRDYPQGYDHFKTRLHAAFVKKRDLTDPLQIQQAIQQGNYIVKELEALYFLSKYRELKRRYDTSPDNAFMMEVMESKLAKLSTADPQR